MSVVTIGKQNFKETVEQNELVLVDFWAPWCGPCKMIAPILDQLAEQTNGKVTIAKLNVDENPEVAGQYGVQSIPTLKLFKKGKVVNTMVGLQSLESLKRLVASTQ